MKNQNINLAVEIACKRIAPAWPLKNSVAVNPYLGMSGMTFRESAKVLAERSSINISMPLSFYLNAYEKEEISVDDLQNALDKNKKSHLKPAAFLSRTKLKDKELVGYKGFKVKTLIDLVEVEESKHYNDFMVDKISAWASSYYDQYQALWNTTDVNQDLFESWKKDAEVDRSADLMGVKDFRLNLSKLPNSVEEVTQFILQKIDVPEEVLESYLHTLLLKVVGWSSFVSGEDWNQNLYGGSGDNLKSFLAILLCWEYCILQGFRDKGIALRWDNHLASLQIQYELGKIDEQLDARVIFQDAYDFACERTLKDKINAQQKVKPLDERAKAQVVFCIDVRSEVYRRNLEKVDAKVETIGFAGFFGFPINYLPVAHDEGKNSCPVLIPSGAVVKEKFANNEKATKTRKRNYQLSKTFRSFKSGAVSSFGFVSPVGLFYLFKLIGDSFGITRPVTDPNIDGLGKHMAQGQDLDLSGISLEDKIEMAAGAIGAMGLNENMAPLVVIAGHGATSVNNPHASGLHCGACGGHSGEVNAMTAEIILNDEQVRSGLVLKGIFIPDDTYFVAAKHDTTTDEMQVMREQFVPASHKLGVKELKETFSKASAGSRLERFKRFNLKGTDANKEIIKRSKDWSQTRPEWGLAGCHAFVIAPRHRTSGINLEGKSFLQSYDWRSDENFNVLESIMTAPMVVTSWINLQYYASTTDNERMGAGNKTLHNVTGGVGVLEGSAGDLRIGLAKQSIHDGSEYQHLPQRLNVIIEAPLSAITEILKKHESVRKLCDNSWVTLLAMDENGIVCNRYNGNLNWEKIDETSTNKENLITV
jgi:hypothetical protein